MTTTNTKDLKVLKYILLKIQSGDWSSGDKIPSERWFAIKFNTSKSLVHNILIKLVHNSVIESRSNTGYYVKPQDSANIIKSITYLQGKKPSTTKLIKEGETLFSKEDFKVFKSLNVEKALISKFSYVTKTFEDDNNIINGLLHVGFNVNLIDLPTSTLHHSTFSEGNLRFWSEHGIAISERDSLIKYEPNNFPNFFPNADHLIVTYQIMYNFENNLLEIGKYIVPATDSMNIIKIRKNINK